MLKHQHQYRLQPPYHAVTCCHLVILVMLVATTVTLTGETYFPAGGFLHNCRCVTPKSPGSQVPTDPFEGSIWLRLCILQQRANPKDPKSTWEQLSNVLSHPHFPIKWSFHCILHPSPLEMRSLLAPARQTRCFQHRPGRCTLQRTW